MRNERLGGVEGGAKEEMNEEEEENRHRRRGEEIRGEDGVQQKERKGTKTERK